MVDYIEVLRCLRLGTDKGLDKFAAVAKRHMHTLVESGTTGSVHLLPPDDDDPTRWVAHVTVVCCKEDGRVLSPVDVYEKWAKKLYGMVNRLVLMITCDNPQELSLVGPLWCNVLEVGDAYSFSVKQKWTFSGA